MTEREEQAIIVLNTLYNNPLLSDIHRQALEVGVMAIKAASSSEKPNKWIPVSERLPEVGSNVLVCYEFKKHRSVYIASFYGDGKFHGLDDEYLTTEGRKYRKAVAWMPLPEPYKAESEELKPKRRMYKGCENCKNYQNRICMMTGEALAMVCEEWEAKDEQG